jgi:hypothetical protein
MVTSVAQPKTPFSILISRPSILAGMILALALFYQGGTAAPAVLGLALFGGLALVRPDLALLFVPLTAPLYLIPANIAGIRTQGFQLPLHEVALLIAFVASAADWFWRVYRRAGWRAPTIAPAVLLRVYAPHLLFLIAGVLGVLIALERSRALREFRWVIAEPLLFYALIKYYILQDERRKTKDERAAVESSSSVLRLPSGFTLHLLIAFGLSGAIVGLLALLQYAGIDLVPLLGEKQCFAPDGGVCSNVVADGGLRRVLSVYGHPNNLGLALGRVWPLAAALALAPTREHRTKNRSRRRLGLFFVLCSLFCLAGIVVSFSRGAWLGAAAALAVLALGLINNRRLTTQAGGGSSFVVHPSSFKWLIGIGVGVLVLAGLALSLRGDVTAGSTPIRLLLWREALGYIRLHPLGIGLDQFGVYHDPQSPLSLIDPSLVGTSEQYAAHPHNLVLDIWLRLGPLGLLAFGWLLARSFRAALRHIQHPIILGALAALTAALVHGLVDNFYFVSDLALAFWLLIALVELTQTWPTIRGT